jgi:hypothetical protein
MYLVRWQLLLTLPPQTLTGSKAKISPSKAKASAKKAATTPTKRKVHSSAIVFQTTLKYLYRPLQSGGNLFAVSAVCLKHMPYAPYVTMPHAAYFTCLNSGCLVFPSVFVCTGTRYCASCRFTQLRVSRLRSCRSVFELRMMFGG